MAVALEICEMIDGFQLVKDIAENRIMDQDYRSSEWANAASYKGEPLTIMDAYGYVKPSIVVNESGINRSLVLRGAGRYSQRVDVWIYTPRGIAGMANMRLLMETILGMHESSIPSNPIMMIASMDGPLDDQKNLMTRVAFDVTYIPGEPV